MLVLAPTRELAAQIADSFRAYGQFVASGRRRDRRRRLASARRSRCWRAASTCSSRRPAVCSTISPAATSKLGDDRSLVLDEADHMLDLGFIVPIRQIVAKLPKKRQNLFFSATMPKEIAGLAGDMLNDPVAGVA